MKCYYLKYVVYNLIINKYIFYLLFIFQNKKRKTIKKRRKRTNRKRR